MNSKNIPRVIFWGTNLVTENQEIAKGVEIQTFLETNFRVRRRQEPSREFSGTPREPQGRFQDPFRADPKVFKYHWFYKGITSFFRYQVLEDSGIQFESLESLRDGARGGLFEPAPLRPAPAGEGRNPVGLKMSQKLHGTICFCVRD